MSPSPPVHRSWTPEATAILQRAYEHHGGLSRWRTLQYVELIPKRLSGCVPWIKGVGRSFPVPACIRVLPHERATVFVAYPERGSVGTFSNGDVRIDDATGGIPRVTASSAEHRRTFGVLSKYRRWSPLDALYFFGYSLWHYHVLPFSLAEGRLLAFQTRGRRQERRYVFRIELPADIPTHCRVQSFQFDALGRLVRHDYVADILGSWARGAHIWSDYRTVDGMPIAMNRTVFARVGSVRLPIPVLTATFADAAVVRSHR